MNVQRNLYTKKSTVHTEVFTQRSPCTHKILHTDGFTQRSLFTEELLHRETFTQRNFYTEQLFHTGAFTQESLHRGALTHRSFYIETHRRIYIQKLSHREFFSQRSLYTEELSRTEAFTQRSLYTDRGTFTHRSFYTEKSLHRETFTLRRVYKQMFLHRSFTHRKLSDTETFTQRSLCTAKLLHAGAFTRFKIAIWHYFFTFGLHFVRKGCFSSFKFCNFAPVFDGSSYTEELTSRWSTCIWTPYQTRTSQVLLNFSPLAARAARRWLTKRDPLQGLWVSDAQTCGELWWNALFLSVASPLRTSKTGVKLQFHNAKWKCRGVKLQFWKISCNPFAQNEGRTSKN